MIAHFQKWEVIEHYRKIYEPRVMVETGTFLGDTVDHFKNKFESVISIELSEDLAKKAMKRFANTEGVRIIEGDSSLVLPGILPELNSPVLFWLDGHYSFEFFVNNEFIRTAKGETKTPIEKELDIILQSEIESVILVDDARLFTGKEDYPSIKSVKRKVKKYKVDRMVFVKNDIIHIIPKRK